VVRFDRWLIVWRVVSAELDILLPCERPLGDGVTSVVQLVNSEASVSTGAVVDLSNPRISYVTRRKAKVRERHIVDVNHLCDDIAWGVRGQIRLPIPGLGTCIRDYHQADLAARAAGARVLRDKSTNSGETQAVNIGACLRPVSERAGRPVSDTCVRSLATRRENTRQTCKHDAPREQNLVSPVIGRGHIHPLFLSTVKQLETPASDQ
jgi:hypothetical protein